MQDACPSEGVVNFRRWEREIELQKVHGLTPSEATLYAFREAGLTVSEIAEMSGWTVQAVKNAISIAKRKINGERQMELYILRQGQANDPDGLKGNITDVLAEFCKRTTDMQVDYLTHITRIHNIDSRCPGDIEWMNSNVFRYVSLVGTRSKHSSSDRADSLFNVYKEKMETQGIQTPMMGVAVLRYWLDRYMITYDIGGN